MTEIKITKGQIKSIEDLFDLAYLLDGLEKLVGIKTVKITLDYFFVCPDIAQDLEKYKFGTKPMQRTLLKILDLN